MNTLGELLAAFEDPQKLFGVLAATDDQAVIDFVDGADLRQQLSCVTVFPTSAATIVTHSGRPDPLGVTRASTAPMSGVLLLSRRLH